MPGWLDHWNAGGPDRLGIERAIPAEHLGELLRRQPARQRSAAHFRRGAQAFGVLRREATWGGSFRCPMGPDKRTRAAE